MNKINLALLLFISGATHPMEISPRKSDDANGSFLVSSDREEFESHTLDERWDRYSKLLAAFDKQSNTIKILNERNGKLQEDKLELEKKSKDDLRLIAKLKIEKEKRCWKTIGVTFLTTVSGLAVLGKFIDKK